MSEKNACPVGTYSSEIMARNLVKTLLRRTSHDLEQAKVDEIIEIWKSKFNPFNPERPPQESVEKELGLNPCDLCFFLYGYWDLEKTEKIDQDLRAKFENHSP